VVAAIIADADAGAVVLDCPCKLDMQKGVMTTRFKAIDEYFMLEMEYVWMP